MSQNNHFCLQYPSIKQSSTHFQSDGNIPNLIHPLQFSIPTIAFGSPLFIFSNHYSNVSILTEIDRFCTFFCAYITFDADTRSNCLLRTKGTKPQSQHNNTIVRQKNLPTISSNLFFA
eukprot:TRINITY_DN11690_c0_g1_i1.p1 TRINITY_DN11690_c0_g1~~TRINITY_DN11690_c0_g1_i1.p1  ORF type:complete len:118 (+),score=15.29 TRINITY_DN11690_c0_g1_i1:159-512(+)